MDFVNVLKRTDIFYDLSPDQLEMVSELCDEAHYRTGEMIFAEQSSSDELYIVARGEVEILVDPSIIDARPMQSRPVTIATMRAGQIFGEIALVDQGLRSAGARSAAENTRLLIIPRSKLLNLCDNNPELGYKVMRNLAADLALKMRGADLTIREQLLWGGRRGG